jgi:hypothetical protein
MERRRARLMGRKGEKGKIGEKKHEGSWTKGTRDESQL